MLPRCKGMRCQRSSFLLLRNSRLNDCKDCRDDSEMITICCRPTGIQKPSAWSSILLLFDAFRVSFAPNGVQIWIQF